MNENPIIIPNITGSYFSIARYSGGAVINGKTYIYYPERDILVRSDWDKFFKKLRWEDFISAVKKGVKPSIKDLRKKVIDRQKSLFADEEINTKQP